ncbi:MAG: helix-turn-helix domain-containing protein [Anaerolineales bacterium]
MIDPDKRRIVYLLHHEGMSIREISQRLHLSRNTIRRIIAQEGKAPSIIRKDKQEIDPQLLREVHQQCQGRIQRMHEILTEEKNIKVSYPTLTRMLRELGISNAPKKRCHRVPDEPGAEMQHDTTLYTIRLAGKPHKITASVLYLRYSKRRYLTFHRGFNRFQMKCALHQALTHWGYAASRCIIDNTNLARLRGTGKAAIINPEMSAFSQQYGFQFHCHEIRHPNRKAGNERSFWTAENNFLPGRTFESLEDLNEQALAWATERQENRPQGKVGLIPAKAFDHERAYLTKLTSHLPAPYRIHSRSTDQYGYVAFAANYYWVPGSARPEVKVLEYAKEIKIYHHREYLIVYPLPGDGVRNELFSPEGEPKPPHQPRQRRKPAREEEERLRAISPLVADYLDGVLKQKGHGRSRFLRSLLSLSRKMTPELFIKSIARAAQYRIEDIAVIDRIAFLHLQEGSTKLPAAGVDEHLMQREAYLEGSLTEVPDLTLYQERDIEDTES